MTKTTSLLSALLCTLIWGTTFIAQDTGMDDIGPFTFNAVRFFIGFLAIVPLVFLDCKRKFPWYTTHGYPGSLRVKTLETVRLDKEKLTIEMLKQKVYRMIKRELELDPKKASLNAIKIWKKIKKID